MNASLRSRSSNAPLNIIPRPQPSVYGGCGPNCAYKTISSCTTSESLLKHYVLDPSSLSAHFRGQIRRLDLDFETDAFLTSCRGSFCTDLLASFLRIFFSVTDTNAILCRGSMFVLSTTHAQSLLSLYLVDRGKVGSEIKKLLDIGAGDGEVTSKLAPLFHEVHVTEVSKQMGRRLRQKGFVVTITPDISPGPNFYGEGTFDVVSLLNLLDRCDNPADMIVNAAKLMKRETGLMLIALVLPYSEFVEEGPRRRKVRNPLPMHGFRCSNGVTFEQSLNAFLERVILPLGLEVVHLARSPYLCRGDYRNPYYVLSDALIVLRHGPNYRQQSLVSAVPVIPATVRKELHDKQQNFSTDSYLENPFILSSTDSYPNYDFSSTETTNLLSVQ